MVFRATRAGTIDGPAFTIHALLIGGTFDVSARIDAFTRNTIFTKLAGYVDAWIDAETIETDEIVRTFTRCAGIPALPFEANLRVGTRGVFIENSIAIIIDSITVIDRWFFAEAARISDPLVDGAIAIVV